MNTCITTVAALTKFKTQNCHSTLIDRSLQERNLMNSAPSGSAAASGSAGLATSSTWCSSLTSLILHLIIVGNEEVCFLEKMGTHLWLLEPNLLIRMFNPFLLKILTSNSSIDSWLHYEAMPSHTHQYFFLPAYLKRFEKCAFSSFLSMWDPDWCLLSLQVTIMVASPSTESNWAVNAASEMSSEHLTTSLQYLPFTLLTTAGQGHSKCCYPTPTLTHFIQTSVTTCGWRTPVLLLIFYSQSHSTQLTKVNPGHQHW